MADTFTVLVAARIRQTALLRLLGATRGQVLGWVLAEAAAVGLVAAVAGLLADAGSAVGLRSLLHALGNTLPPGGLVLMPRTVAAGLAVGVLVTTAAAVAPARRASRVAPLQALRESTPAPAVPAHRARAAVGLLLAVLAAAAIAAGLAGWSTASRPRQSARWRRSQA